MSLPLLPKVAEVDVAQVEKCKPKSRGVSDSPIELSDDDDDNKVMTQEEHNRHWIKMTNVS